MQLPKCAAALLVLGLAACTAGSGGSVSVSGDGAVGISASSGATVQASGGLGGPPPGRTSAERQARKDYYRGPRGQEF